MPETETARMQDGFWPPLKLDAADALQLSGWSQADACDALLPCRLRGSATEHSRLSVQNERRGGEPETDAMDGLCLSVISLCECRLVGCASPPSISTEFLAARLRGTPATDCSGWPRFDLPAGNS
mmetsp:Transcript_36553/g.100864  ORF Transcript_36553/g.100864 Transcript_36553/m.100864 type:complete len:125 (+) Transcript_36553:230-604(+)